MIIAEPSLSPGAKRRCEDMAAMMHAPEEHQVPVEMAMGPHAHQRGPAKRAREAVTPSHEEDQQSFLSEDPGGRNVSMHGAHAGGREGEVSPTAGAVAKSVCEVASMAITRGIKAEQIVLEESTAEAAGATEELRLAMARRRGCPTAVIASQTAVEDAACGPPKSATASGGAFAGGGSAAAAARTTIPATIAGKKAGVVNATAQNSRIYNRIHLRHRSSCSWQAKICCCISMRNTLCTRTTHYVLALHSCVSRIAAARFSCEGQTHLHARAEIEIHTVHASAVHVTT